MDKIKKIYLSYWFDELKDNPSSKVYELEDEVKSIITEPLMFNEDNSHNNLIIPRIQGISNDKKYLLTISYINAILSIEVNDIDIDEAILLINSNIQLFYDIIKRVYGVKILYSSIKVEMINEDKKIKEKFIKNLELSDKQYENVTLKQGFIKDNYYVNYIEEVSVEYNFDFSEKLSEEDLFNKSMITSLSNAHMNREYLFTVIEINDRYSFNKDPNYESCKDDLRGMIMELKDILNNKLYWPK